MPPPAQALQDLNNAREDLRVARQASDDRLVRLAAREGELQALQRTRPAGHQDIADAEANRAHAVTDLRAARDSERKAKDEIQTKLKVWLSGFAANDLEEAGELDGKFPLVMLPVR